MSLINAFHQLAKINKIDLTQHASFDPLDGRDQESLRLMGGKYGRIQNMNDETDPQQWFHYLYRRIGCHKMGRHVVCLLPGQQKQIDGKVNGKKGYQE